MNEMKMGFAPERSLLMRPSKLEELMRLRVWLIAALAATVGGPVLAAECAYISGMDQGSLVFAGQGAVLSDAMGDKVDCSVTWGDEGGNVLACEGQPEANFSLGSSKRGGDDQEELLVLWDHLWYRECP